MKLIKEEYEQMVAEGDLELWSDDDEAEVVVDMTGREYSVKELASFLADDDLAVLMSKPGAYFVRIRDGKPSGIGPD